MNHAQSHTHTYTRSSRERIYRYGNIFISVYVRMYCISRARVLVTIELFSTFTPADRSFDNINDDYICINLIHCSADDSSLYEFWGVSFANYGCVNTFSNLISFSLFLGKIGPTSFLCFYLSPVFLSSHESKS